ncbi:nuclear transport factor 2 family protein [Lutibacter sp.]|uniref:nuclear transport factor 2 family protein n=1 Tax=Lutibacter sp. TaxID=1925666 RepID=UPI002733AA94|nr:nuclear transport factor 2 family protein [Lutibacter sp.]MDP3312397.1 nuclear transport factor 2 family protein [Lutibacter sp.]
MKLIWLVFFTFVVALLFNSKITAQKMEPTTIAQGQLDAYNNQNIIEFLSWYADDVEVYNFPNELVYKGKEEMSKRYINAWKLNPNQKAAVTNRLQIGNTVIDKEHITGRSSGIEANVFAIFKIENDKIVQVYFIRE